MSISRPAVTQFRLRIVAIISICILMVALGSMAFPSRSRAKAEPPQQSKGVAKRKRLPFAPGEILVRYRSETRAKGKTGTAVVATREGQLLPMQVEQFDRSNLVEGLRLAHVEAKDTLRALAALRNQPDVVYAELNYILHTDVTTPNDTHFADPGLYGLAKVGAPLAWDSTQGSNSVVVGVVDQGIDINHLDLQPNVWTNPMPGSLSAQLGISGDLHGYDFIHNSGTFFGGADTESHASHVAGIVGAKGNNGKGVVGMNWNVGLMSLKFLDEFGNGKTSNAIRACAYAKGMRDLWISSGQTKGANVRVLNGSFGTSGFSQAFQDSINQLNSSGILFVAAAGNISNVSMQANNELAPHYPSSFNAPNLLAVAATTQSDALASFSHFGATSVDLGAPGLQVLSTTPHCSSPSINTCLPKYTDLNGDTYSYLDGTSMAAPHVSGAAALLWAKNPNLTVQEVKNLLLLDGDPVNALNGKTLSGRRLNVASSLQSLAIGDTIAPGAVTNFHVDSQNGRAFNLGWTASGDDGPVGQAALYELSFTDGTTAKVIPLRGVIPVASGATQTAQITIPYRHISGAISLREFDELGNAGVPVELPVTIPIAVGDPYVASLGSVVPLTTGGELQAVDADDAYIDYILPGNFTFPFFGTDFTSLTISTNGSLYFSSPPLRDNGDADDVPSSPGALGGYQMIAGLWEDLDLRIASRSTAGIYVTPPDQQNPNRIIFRWQGVPCDFDPDINICKGGDPVNFEIELRTDGTIKSRYGAGNTELFPTVGIGGGDQDGYVITAPLGEYTSEETRISLMNAAEVIYTPRAPGPTPTPSPSPTPTPSPSPSPSPAPLPLQLIMEESAPVPTLAVALDSMLFLRDPFPVINSNNLFNPIDPNTRVVIFVTNLELAPGEPPSAVVVQLIDMNNQTHNIPAEEVRLVPNFGFSQVIFRLPNNLPVGSCSLSVSAHSQVSNSATIRIRM